MVQVYVLNKIPHLHQFITPYIYFLYLLWLPFNISRIGLLITGFITGMALDFFAMTPGLHAAACVLVAYGPFVINILTKRSSEFNYREPSPKAMGERPTWYTF
jgi:rod shape-determining protein MreD